MLNRKLLSALGLAAATLAVQPVIAAVDQSLPDYKRTSGVAGSLNSVGSDTLNNLMTMWGEEFNRFYPNVNFQVQGAGSSTAPPAITEGTAQLAPMSREMRSGEIAAFEQRYGYAPTAIGVAIDALAVFVHKDNPIKGLTMQQVDAMFSSTRACGGKQDIDTWGKAGLTGEWANRSVQLYGRNSVSGTYGYFKNRALCRGDYKNSVNEQPGSASVVQGVSASINGIGYSGVGYLTASVRSVPLAQREGEPFYESSPENAANGKFPLARLLYVYVNNAPNKAMDPATKEFMTMVLSKQGQQVVLNNGYVPLPKAAADRELKKLQ
ncbi:phosphate ABC transporter substrate-binding protein PstS family protein [Thiomicrospira microaerophila]|uniref:PstS family phosphate ABC transporter substrate-binding protein n=1 Tax=Thiomicrospira microaerophila TaxID=406020 RepID=UPI00200E4725|nr:phosphate ABC transporter substrate-binding protein PstS family protein [Thiomicrospira microaerophila]UQB43120.1 phosphate ABC transporter substrate-binding protein PstS family protein [Thiomicrospira microaerophila]